MGNYEKDGRYPPLPKHSSLKEKKPYIQETLKLPNKI